MTEIRESTHNYYLRNMREARQNQDSNTISEMDMMKINVAELQRQVQESYIKQKTLIELIDELNRKIEALGHDPKQMELPLE